MRLTTDLALVVLGLGLVLGGTLGTARASSACSGMVLLTGGGSGGGIICSGDCPEDETCDVKTSMTTTEPPAPMKWCDCTNTAQPLCCTIFWINDPLLGDLALHGGTCQVPGQPPCPQPGTCGKQQNGSQFTAVCD